MCPLTLLKLSGTKIWVINDYLLTQTVTNIISSSFPKKHSHHVQRPVDWPDTTGCSIKKDLFYEFKGILPIGRISSY